MKEIKRLLRLLCILGFFHLMVMGGTVSAATPISFGETVTGTISTPGQIDSYSFFAGAGDRAFIRIFKWTGSSSVRVQVFAPDGTELIIRSGGPEFAFDMVLPVTGTYTIQAMDSYVVHTGTFQLFIQRTNNPLNATEFSYGECQSATISQGNPMHSYTLAGDSGDFLIFHIWSSWNDRGRGNWLWLYAPDGSRVIQCDVAYEHLGPWTPLGDMAVKVPQSGTYTLLVGSGGSLDLDTDLTGTYNLFIQRTNNPGNSVHLTYGDSVYGTITKPAQRITYTFSGTAGDTVYVRLLKDGVDDLMLYAPNGTEIGSASYWHYGVNSITIQLTDTGTYTLLTGYVKDENPGTYNLYLQRMNNPDDRVFPLPDVSNFPTDPDGDGIYEDLNANGRLDFADVVLYFNQMTWIATNEPIAAFDLNGNGRIDFADIVALFNEI